MKGMAVRRNEAVSGSKIDPNAGDDAPEENLGRPPDVRPRDRGPVDEARPRQLRSVLRPVVHCIPQYR
jgi:hypothetical protein